MLDLLKSLILDFQEAPLEIGVPRRITFRSDGQGTGFRFPLNPDSSR